MKHKVAVIVQARCGSKRLPGKVLEDIGGREMLTFLVERLKRSRSSVDLILATTEREEDATLAELGKKLGLKVVRGSEQDVLGRFALAASYTDASVLVRITADCPLVDPQLLDEMIEEFSEMNVDYLSNCVPPSYPDGLDIEIFRTSTLITANSECIDEVQREHVTPWIRECGRFRLASKRHSADYSGLRWTVDEPEDLTVIRSVVDYFEGRSDFSWKEVLHLQETQPQLFEANVGFGRNEGASMGGGEKLWKRARRVIPGGNMLLSKRAEMFLPGRWPTYFSKAKGSYIWDLDGRRLIDMSLMGVGTNILGYGQVDVDQAVASSVAAGNMSTLNCPEEVLLAERLIDMHPWADMAKFARSGGEANAVAVRIARAATGRDTVAVCGYHGWHDWYLATNLRNESGLDEHLLPGLEPVGVPKALGGTVKPFSYNRLDQLEEIANSEQLAAVKMEVERNCPPEPGFLEGVRRLCTQRGMVLIFDECTSGFRETFGGLHLKYGISPDMAIFGKALGNGYAITAVIGRREVMECAQNTFISSTFWTERIGPTAALKTLDVMEKERSWEKITITGTRMREIWERMAAKHKLQVKLSGIAALSSFAIEGVDPVKYKTLITQEMLKKGFIANTTFYAALSHTRELIESYELGLDGIFASIAECESGRTVDELLECPKSQVGFRRLN